MGGGEKVKKFWPFLLDGDGGSHRSLTRPFPTYPKRGRRFLALGLTHVYEAGAAWERGGTGRGPTPSTLQTWAAGASGGFHGWCACAGARRPASWHLVDTEPALVCKGRVWPALLSCGVITNASSLPGLGGRLLRLL